MAAKRKSIILTIIRCGSTPWDAEGRLRGRSDLPLSIDGRAAVSEDLSVLSGRSLTTVFHPSDDAASETAQIAARIAGAKLKSLDDLADADLGVLDGMTERDFADRFPKRFKQWQEDPLSLSPPEGEDLADARARLFAAIGRLLRRSRSDEVAVVLPPLGLGFLRCWLADRPPSELWAMLRDRRRVEHYRLAPQMVDWLIEAARAAYTHT